MYRYYLTQRAPGPGAIPNGLTYAEDFGCKRYVEEIGREAWGYVEYTIPLTEKQIENYELIGVARERIDEVIQGLKENADKNSQVEIRLYDNKNGKAFCKYLTIKELLGLGAVIKDIKFQ